jgi:hypothetical protein
MYIYVAILIAGLATGFAGGWKTQGWRHDAAELARTQVESRDRVKKMDRGDEAATAHEEDKAKIQTKYVTIVRKVDRVVQNPAYRSVCLPADGLQLANDAITRGEAASLPAPAVPRSAPPK